MDWNQKFSATNESETVIVTGIIALKHLETIVVDPSRHPESTINDLKIFNQRGMIKASNDIKETADAAFDVAVKTIFTSGKNGAKNEHVVLDEPKRAISVESIDMGGKAVNVDNMLEQKASPAMAEVEEPMTEKEATELLGLHWKRFESEVGRMNDPKKLNMLLVTAEQTGAAEKKKQIVQTRLEQI